MMTTMKRCFGPKGLIAAMLDPCPLGPNMEKELEESNDLAFLLALDMWGDASQK